MGSSLIKTSGQFEHIIFTIRGLQVMVDRDVAILYHAETRVLNQAVARNMDRFPEEFCFKLGKEEFENWKSQIVISNADKMGLRKPPTECTEQDFAMLSAVLKSDTAIKVRLQIMKAFVAMRKTIAATGNLVQRIEGVEKKSLQTDGKFEKIGIALEQKEALPTQGIFFSGQIFDAYQFVADIIRKANHSIVWIDNDVDDRGKRRIHWPGCKSGIVGVF